MRSVLAAVHAAMHPDTAAVSLFGEEPGAQASNNQPQAGNPGAATSEEVVMTEQTRPGADTNVAAAANLAASLTGATANATGDLATSIKAAATEAKDRIKAILTSPKAEGRTKLAEHLAFNTDSSPEAAEAILDASPAAGAPEAGADDYEKQRLASAGLAQPVTTTAAAQTTGTLKPSAIYDKRRESMKGA
ncbi:hypothetical protein HDIA_1982 [Hartmannibacter diazotrophicus]|uniref:Uncharacterized protein n=1 Tax=Hartmannibacter diazotrophicus TaxID=1482074 RepID=A0A2C9D5K1_9HYPH|nr:hypothetical protein [Hartmannibacter diazotrophicus]SON55523.1 hypothetical protein HDIA_1982 [Hartmannibacter diazotrophicus]